METIDFVYRYGYFLSEETGKAWYRGRQELLVEVPFSFVQSPRDGQMMGISFLACRNFTSSRKIVPYVFAGGGPVYTNLNIPDLGTELNGNYQAGAGLRFFVSDRISLDLNCRFHHISNADTAKPNIPLNSTKFFLGISFYQ
ncbi:MAG: acyloxyacyl hydrolase [Candidatus Ratteibacteria bacterium]